MAINPDDVAYSYNVYGYTLYYKGRPIFAAGVDKRSLKRKPHRSNLKLYRDEAELMKNKICSGFIGYGISDLIEKIDNEGGLQ